MRPLPSSLARGYSHCGAIFNPPESPSLEQFPGDSYSNVQKPSDGRRRFRGGWERCRRRESARTAEKEIETRDKSATMAEARQEAEGIGSQ